MLQAGHRRARGAILAGYLLSVLCVLLLSSLGIAINRAVDAGLIGYLGVIPLSLGLWALVQRQRGTTAAEALTPVLPARSALIGSAALMLGNSGDSLALLLPMMAETAPAGRGLLAIIYLAAAIAWAALAYGVASKAALARVIERRGAAFVPWLMIMLGVYILSDTPTDTLL